MKDKTVERKLSPADVDAAIPSQQDVGDVLATAQQGMLDVSARRRGASVLRRGSISGEANLEVVESTTGHEALQLLSGNTSGELLGQLLQQFSRQGGCCFHKEVAFTEASFRAADGGMW